MLRHDGSAKGAGRFFCRLQWCQVASPLRLMADVRCSRRACAFDDGRYVKGHSSLCVARRVIVTGPPAFSVEGIVARPTWVFLALFRKRFWPFAAGPTVP